MGTSVSLREQSVNYEEFPLLRYPQISGYTCMHNLKYEYERTIQNVNSNLYVHCCTILLFIQPLSLKWGVHFKNDT